MGCRIVFAVLLALSASWANAELGARTGEILKRKLPPPTISQSLVLLDVPHVRQKPDYCVPSSASMILGYYGRPTSQTEIKNRAESHKPKDKQNWTFTYFVDLQKGLRTLGHRWDIRSFPKTNAGFNKGLAEIQRSLKKGRPVMIDVHQGPGHTFVLIGFDDAKQVVFIRDPNMPSSRARQLTYDQMRSNWHNHRFGPHRTAVFSKPPK
ncbi:C39 family peptidase [Shimia sp. MIT910701]|uniref:C39 family peptidase n=1 Tax=Shimia sp. MIT910701 TaxID=3096987 RepID=UPI003999A4E1